MPASEMSMSQTERQERLAAAEGVGIGVAITVAAGLLTLLTLILFDLSRGGRVGLLAGAAALGSLGLGGALQQLADFRREPAFENWGVAVMVGGLGGALVALPALEVLSGTLGTVATVVGFALLLIALVGGGIGGGKWFARPRVTDSEAALGLERSASRLSRSEHLMLLLAFLQVVGTFAGLFFQS